MKRICLRCCSPPHRSRLDIRGFPRGRQPRGRGPCWRVAVRENASLGRELVLRRRADEAKIAILRKVPLFSACADRELAQVAGLVDVVTLDPGQTLIRHGSIGTQCFVIIDGQARAYIGEEELAILSSGTVVGAMALLDGGRRAATVMAITPMRLVVIAHREFSTLLVRHYSVVRGMLRALAGQVRELDAVVMF